MKTIKEFLKPNWWKVGLFFVIFILVILHFYKLPFAPLFGPISLIIFLWLPTIFKIIHSNYPSLIITALVSLFYWYLLACIIYYIFSTRPSKKGILIIIILTLLLAFMPRLGGYYFEPGAYFGYIEYGWPSPHYTPGPSYIYPYVFAPYVFLADLIFNFIFLYFVWRALKFVLKRIRK